MNRDCIIVGGGASGLAAAARLAEGGLNVLLLERLDRVGKKILSTGNGRCNLSNTRPEPECYGSAADFVRRLWESVPPEEVLRFFDNIGLMTAGEDGRIYPRTFAAASVLDVLRNACTKVESLTGSRVVSAGRYRRTAWCVQTEDGASYTADRLLLCAGGCAAPKLGTDGSGYELARMLGHSVTPLYPSLVQLKSPHPALKSLKGIRAAARVTLFADGKELRQETGELLFTDYGLSGVCIFQLSADAARALAEKRKTEVRVCLLPEFADAEIPQILEKRIARMQGAPLSVFLTGMLPRLLAQAVLRQAELSAETSCSSLTEAERERLADALQRFPFAISGTNGFEQAQVTAGGVRLDEIDPASMESLLCPHLYLCGELTDVSGPCGGFNLHYAFASGLAAANAILRETGVSPNGKDTI